MVGAVGRVHPALGRRQARDRNGCADSRGLTELPFPIFTSAAAYVERIRMVDPDRLESEVTVKDPATLAAPWAIKLSYQARPAMDRMFHMPFDDDRSTQGADGFFRIAPVPAP